MKAEHPEGTVSNGDQAAIAAFLAPLAGRTATSVAVMVSSVDGRVTVNGRVGPLTGGPDQQVLLGLREMAAVVVAGGGTVRAEGYEGLLDEEAQERRTRQGLPGEPELAVFTRRTGAGLPAGARALSAPPLPDGRPDLPAAWRELRERHGNGLIVCEGGPTLLGQLVLQRMLDQLLVCVSPQLIGAESSLRLIERAGGLAEEPLSLTLLDLVSVEDFVFLRYGATP